MNKMTGWKTLGAAIALAALPLMAPSASFAQGPGPCTSAGGHAVGAEGPAMSGGQLMAGVGQCRSIGGWHHRNGYYGYRDYGYRRWDGGPVGWALGTAGAVATGLALGQPYYGAYGYYGPNDYTDYDSPRFNENY
jgi:hypothetical protein